MQKDRQINMKTTAIFPGSFDPLTLGHLNIIEKASRLFDRVIIGVLPNNTKTPLFSVDERVNMIKEATKDLGNVDVESYEGLLIDYCRERKISIIIRGLRAITDFEYEFQIDAVNRQLSEEIRTVYFMASPSHSFLSSSNVKEIGFYGGSITGLVPLCNENFIRERLAKQ